MHEVELSLRLLRGLDEDTPVDPAAAVLRQQTVVGRSAENDLVLAHATVSRQHARFTRSPNGWVVENLSSANGLFVEGVSIPPGADAVVPPGSCTIQIGGLLFACESLEGTRPVTEAMVVAAPEADADDARVVVRIVRDGDAATVHVGGRLVTIKPLASLVLHALAERAGDVVHEWDLLERIGRDAHLSQAVSEIRRAFRRLVQNGTLTEHDVKRWICETTAETATDTALPPGPALFRQLVRARRGHGYALLIPTNSLDVDEAG